MKRLSIIAFLLFTAISSSVVWAIEHTVKPGETLYSISKQYNIPLSELQKINNLEDPSLLKVGMVLSIPDGVAPASLTQNNNTVSEHVVQKGDTYYNIAQRYNLSVEELLTLNNRNADRVLQLGEILIVKQQPQKTAPATSDGTKQKQTINTPSIWPGSGDNGRTVNLPPDEIIEDDKQETPASISNIEDDLIKTISWPIQGSIQPHNGRQGGVIISTQKDASVLSVSTGTVAFIGPYRELGNIIVIERSGGYLYIYGGLDAVFVTTGQEVDVGTSLGVITSNNGKIIFSVHKDANIINPSSAPRN